MELPIEDDDYLVSLSSWWEVMILENGLILSQEANMNKWGTLVKEMKKRGLVGYYEQKWMDEGIEKGVQQGVQNLLKYWESGHSLEEAKKKFAFS